MAHKGRSTQIAAGKGIRFVVGMQIVHHCADGLTGAGKTDTAFLVAALYIKLKVGVGYLNVASLLADGNIITPIG